MAHFEDMGKRGREAWAKWRRLVAEQKRSGQSVAAFCRERSLCAPYFYSWKKRLSQSATEKFVAVEVVGGAAPQSSTVGQSIDVRLCGGRSVIVEPGFDAAHLRAVLLALETRA